MVTTTPIHAEIVRVAVSDELAYWTVLAGPTLTVVGDVDDHLRHLRFGRSCEESTTKTYAGHLKRLHVWSEERGLSRNDAALRMAMYVMHLRTTPRASSGRAKGQLPEEATLAPALAAIHGFYLHLADLGLLEAEAFSALFTTVSAETGRGLVAVRPRIRVDARPSHSSARAPAATHEEFTSLLLATDTARDRCMVAITACCALRVGQLVSLMREDIHFVPVGRTAPGCSYVLGPHIHLRKRGGHPKGAANKNRGMVIVPVPGAVEMLYADWMRERLSIRRAGTSPWAFVTFPGPTGDPGGDALSPRRIQDLLSDLSARAGLRHLHPHMLRHTFGETAADLDIARDVLQRLLGHSDVTSQDVYRSVPETKVAAAARAVSDQLFGHS
ncbi:site-specific integrase [Streptomyces sp. OfavH-34-F]|uniref:tyrosine-type recombinase/integrase n=1 Tax=Streptomyces sp. OfavH-34-F TaxID=2917760 RepID=UPI001EF16C83|nr:site-specific integrase [Streptomyces sp. OfavH-34-F]MCG7522846.1 site-specific integrase [Streptomyces sp. OfavH-34-F]